jgi:hypothetical protein
MNDLNDDLIEMFHRREGDVRSPASAPTRLVARTRHREWLTVGVGIVAAVVVVVVSIAGLRSLGSSDGSQPGDVGPTTVSTQEGSGPATGDAGSGDVVASGTDVVGGPWTLTITHQPPGDGIVFVWVEYVNASGTGCCLDNTKIGNHDLVFDGIGWTAGAPTVILAFASTRTARVASEIDGVTYEAKLYPLPARYLGPLQIAVLFLPDAVAPKEPQDVRTLRLVAYDAQGAVLEREGVN